VLTLVKTVSKETTAHNDIPEDIVEENIVIVEEICNPIIIEEEVIKEEVAKVEIEIMEREDNPILVVREYTPFADYHVQFLLDQEESVSEEPIEIEVVEEDEIPSGMIYYDVPLSNKVQEVLFEQCQIMNVPMTLALAVIWTESTYKEELISPTHDYGLMQINRSNHSWLTRDLDVSDFLDPCENVTAGVYMLGTYLTKYGTNHKALMAYNLGETKASVQWKNGITESRYSNLIISRMTQLEVRS